MSNESSSSNEHSLIPPNFYLNVFARPEIKGVSYTDQEMALDGHTYIDCRFNNCSLDVSSLNFDLIGCVFDTSTQITFKASVDNYMHFLDKNFPWANQHLPAFFVPQHNADNTMTIWFIGREF